MNIYDLVNEEIKRLYDLWRLEKEYAHRDDPSMKFGGMSMHDRKAEEIMKEILTFRKLIIASFDGHDQKVQEKIAEMALTDIKS